MSGREVQHSSGGGNGGRGGGRNSDSGIMKDGGYFCSGNDNENHSNCNDEDDDDNCSLTRPHACVACGWVGSLGQECIECGEDSCCYCLDPVSSGIDSGSDSGNDSGSGSDSGSDSGSGSGKKIGSGSGSSNTGKGGVRNSDSG